MPFKKKKKAKMTTLSFLVAPSRTASLQASPTWGITPLMNHNHTTDESPAWNLHSLSEACGLHVEVWAPWHRYRLHGGRGFWSSCDLLSSAHVNSGCLGMGGKKVDASGRMFRELAAFVLSPVLFPLKEYWNLNPSNYFLNAQPITYVTALKLQNNSET